MRIIGGKLKGKTILFTKSNITRPLKDSVKENIFNVLLHSNLIKVDLINSNILDLYSGVGSFGIECLSRGAKNVTFVEKDRNTFKILSENISKLSIKNQATAFNNEIIQFLDKKKFKKFDIIFLDPPYKDKNFLENLQFIQKLRINKKNHLIIMHRERKTIEDLSRSIKPIIIRNYGRSKIIFGKLLA